MYVFMQRSLVTYILSVGEHTCTVMDVGTDTKDTQTPAKVHRKCYKSDQEAESGMHTRTTSNAPGGHKGHWWGVYHISHMNPRLSIGCCGLQAGRPCEITCLLLWPDDFPCPPQSVVNEYVYGNTVY